MTLKSNKKKLTKRITKKTSDNITEVSLPPLHEEGSKEEKKTWWDSEQERLEEEFRNIESDILHPTPKFWTPEYTALLAKFKLTIKQERFCRLYCLSSEYFANATQSYIRAFKTEYYDAWAYNTARTESSRLLANPNILNYMRYLSDVNWFNDDAMDKELLFLCMQRQELTTKRASIRDYNEMKGRIKQKVEVWFDEWLKTFMDWVRSFWSK